MDSKTIQLVEDAKDAVAKIILVPDLDDRERDLAHLSFDYLVELLKPGTTGIEA